MTKNRLKKTIFISFAGILMSIFAYNLWAYQGTLLRPFLNAAETDSPHKPLAEVIKSEVVGPPIPNLLLEVVKSKHTLTLYSGKIPLKSYQISLSKDYLQDKRMAGDRRTPEGSFIITEATSYSPPRRLIGSKLLLLNYPNKESAMIGFRERIITGSDFLAIEKAVGENTTPPQKTPLGGSISIHGGDGPLMGNSWTDGSVALYSKDMEELFQYVPLGTRVVIKR